MDHEGSRIQQSHISTGDDLPLMVDLDQVALLDEGKRNSERVDPECCGIDRIAQGDVSSDTFIEAVLASYQADQHDWIDKRVLSVEIPKMRNAAASLPFKYSRSSYLSVNFGGPGNLGIWTWAWFSERPGSWVAFAVGLEWPLISGSNADGGAMPIMSEN